jgi:excinuclease ABC subunit B
MDVMEGARSAPAPGEKKGRGARVAEPAENYAALSPAQAQARLAALEQRMYQHARDLEFEDAARVRDEIRKLKESSLG